MTDRIKSLKNADGSQQIFVRAFKGGAWQTQGFPESLNEDATKVAQAPSIDFTGPNRTVPWVGWAEPSTALGNDQIFASAFFLSPRRDTALSRGRDQRLRDLRRPRRDRANPGYPAAAW